jgi:hypothetical protein
MVLSVISIPQARGMAGTQLHEGSHVTASPWTKRRGAFMLFLLVAEARPGGPLNRLYYGSLAFICRAGSIS